MKEIANAEAQSLIESGADYYVLDVRTPGEYASSHIPNVMHLDVQSPDFADKVTELPKDKPYLVYCRSGARSAAATKYMTSIGYDATNVMGGIMAWKGEVVEE